MSRQAPSTHPIVEWMIVGACWACITFVLLVAFALYGQVRAQEFPNCAGWIDHRCCCTNDCCSEVRDGEVVQIDADHYRVVASGQVIRRTGWSQDGRFMRCACDWIDGKWTRHPKAMTRCIFPPMPNS